MQSDIGSAVSAKLCNWLSLLAAPGVQHVIASLTRGMLVDILIVTVGTLSEGYGLGFALVWSLLIEPDAYTSSSFLCIIPRHFQPA